MNVIERIFRFLVLCVLGAMIGICFSVAGRALALVFS